MPAGFLTFLLWRLSHCDVQLGRFSPDDKFSRHRVTIKKRFGTSLFIPFWVNIGLPVHSVGLLLTIVLFCRPHRPSSDPKYPETKALN